MFNVVAGINCPSFRAKNLSLIIRGFGVHSASSVGFTVKCLGKLRPKRIPLHPIKGISSELYLPSEFRAWRNLSSGSGSSSAFPWASAEA